MACGGAGGHCKKGMDAIVGDAAGNSGREDEVDRPPWGR
jgi:hypothetical protein